MKKEKVLQNFDELTQAKRRESLHLKLCLGFALAVVVLVLFWGLKVSQNALNKVVVIDRKGEYVETFAEDKDAQFIAFVQNTCKLATEYANSFDRLNLKINQAKAAFYVNKNDLNAVFNKYYADKAYHDATQNGAVYKCELDSVTHIAGGNEPYEVEFYSTMHVYGPSGETVLFQIRTVGELITVTPQYPENVTGFFFNQLIQNIQLKR